MSGVRQRLAAVGVARDRRGVRIQLQASQQVRLARRVDVDRIDQADRAALARVMAAPGDAVAGQFVGVDAQAREDRRGQRGIIVVEGQLDVGESKHAAILPAAIGDTGRMVAVSAPATSLVPTADLIAEDTHMESGTALARRDDDDERALSVREDGPGRGDGASLTRALARRYGDRITGHFTLPGRDGDYAPMPDDVPPALRRALAARGIDRLYRHQAEAWDARAARRTRRHRHPDRLGQIAVLHAAGPRRGDERERAKALYLFPTKALAQDQVAELLELNRAGELGVKAFTFDGDTPGDARQAIRLHGDIVVSNPDMLHQAILPHHTKWAQFFENLRYVVIDEIHTYRGVFGSHVANVLRRLKRICAFYGVRPQFILCSATIGNPKRARRGADRGSRVTAITEVRRADAATSTCCCGIRRWSIPTSACARRRARRATASRASRSSRG